MFFHSICVFFMNRILLQQGPFNGRPVVQRVLIVTPSSLVKNWEKEFRRWLGRERITVFTADQVHKIHSHVSLIININIINFSKIDPSNFWNILYVRSWSFLMKCSFGVSTKFNKSISILSSATKATDWKTPEIKPLRYQFLSSFLVSNVI